MSELKSVIITWSFRHDLCAYGLLCRRRSEASQQRSPKFDPSSIFCDITQK